MKTSNTPNKGIIGFVQMLGPGLLFAGAAIGVSHLVQATKAGATYGYELVWAILLVHIFKYPFFEFGTRYAMSQNETLVEGYNKQGKWVLGIFIAVTIATMFTVQAAVTIVTAGLAISVTGISLSPLVWCGIILLLCAVLIVIGRYAILDNLMKVIIVVLSVSTVIALVVLWLNSTPQSVNQQTINHFNWTKTDVIFLIALMGWMPAPLDLSVWSSIWAIEKRKINPGRSLKNALIDFNVGYIGTIFLALCFVSLGAMVMYGSGQELSQKAGAFASQLINLYAAGLGGWAKPIISIAALTTMFSTTLTCLDAFPRVLAQCNSSLQTQLSPNARKQLFWLYLLVLIVGALVLLSMFNAQMAKMVTLATILSFLTTPFFAIVNYRLVSGQSLPKEHRPSKWMLVLGQLGIVFLIGFCVLYLIYYFVL